MEDMAIDSYTPIERVDKAGAADLPWIEKYRPTSLEELIAHEEIIQILNKLIDSHKLPHLLFYGPPGTGKMGIRYHLMAQ
jgi:replication-associated recombination protein RarA